MGNHARNLIDAVQHLMPGSFIARLTPLVWITTFGRSASGSRRGLIPAWREAVIDGTFGKRTAS